MTRRVLVARLDSAGDVLLAGPALRAIAGGAGIGHGAEPTEVILLNGPQGEAAGSLLPGVAAQFTWECPWIISPAPAADTALMQKLSGFVRGAALDEAIILTSFHQSPLPLALALRLAGVPFITAASTDYAGSLLDVRLRPGEDFPEDQPEPERALTIARAAGYQLSPGDDGKLRVKDVPDVSALVGAGPYIAIHPGAAVPSRRWPALHHAAVVELLTGSGYRVVVTGSGAEAYLTATVAGVAGLDLGGRTDLSTLAGVVSGASVLITGNTGPAHLAAAVGTPVVSLFSPVVPAVRWAPYGVPLELLGDQNAPCRLSRARECPVPGHPCLSSVSPDDVVEAVERLLNGVSSLRTRREVKQR